jgi:hypothetical protein
LESELSERRTLVRYLMGELPAEEEQGLEERYFQDDALFSELLAVEGELIEQYLRGRLSPDEHRRFESVWLASPARRQRLELTRTVLASVSEPPAAAGPREGRGRATGPREGRGRATGLRGLAAVAAGIALLVAVDDVRLRVQVRQAERQVSDLVRERDEWQRRASERPVQGGGQEPRVVSASPGPASPVPGSLGRTMTLALAAGLVRGQAGRQLALQAGVERVILELERPEEPFPSYRAILKNGQDVEIWRGTLESRGARPLRADLEARLLAPAEYRLELRGLAPDGPRSVADYFFRVLPPGAR